MLKLVIGTRNLSSWSLRPWLALKQLGLPFEEILIALDRPTTHGEILKYSPSGRVPCLIDDDTVVWDSLAICEYLAEKAPALLPADKKARAEVRSVSAEMHSGFAALRQELPMDIRADKPGTVPSPAAAADIARIVAIWENCRLRYGQTGPFLFGVFSMADAMYAPVVWRFRTYHTDLPPASREWMTIMLALPAMQEWQRGALAGPD